MHNKVIHKEGGYISFLPGTRPNNIFDRIFNQLPEDETAFVFAEERYMAILTGDWREAVSNLSSMEECFNIFLKNVEKASPWSQHHLMDHYKKHQN